MQSTTAVGVTSKGLALLGVIVIAMLAVGCGSDSKKSDDAFKKDAQAATAQTTQLGADLSDAIQSAGTTSDAKLATVFDNLTTRGRKLVAKLKALDPPDSARQEVDDLIAAVTTGAKDLDAIATAVRASDAKAATAATRKIGADSPAIKSARIALQGELAD
jgi:hypothetical protein